VGILFNGSLGTVIASERDTKDFYYKVLLDNGSEIGIGQYNLAFPESSLFKLVEECKLIMMDCGYRSLLLGIANNGTWTPFFLHSHEEYNLTKIRNTDVKFIHYWSLADKYH
jgi:hypothetical protein